MNINLELRTSTQIKAFATYLQTLASELETAESKVAEYRDKIDTIMEIRGNRTVFEPKEGHNTDIVSEQQADVEEAKAATVRQRGQPSPGKSRRTKAEVAEDEAAEKADVFSQTEPKQAISSGEERVNPEEDGQNDADEAAEMADRRDGDALTHEDLRKALAEYGKKHGMKAAVAAVKPDGIIGSAVDQVPQERIADVISDLVNARPSQSETKAEEPAAPKYPATKDGLMKAMLAYALKYDGTDDISKASTDMPNTMADAPKVFQMRFGEAVNSLSKVPADGYAQAILDMQEALEKNPFKREIVNG